MADIKSPLFLREEELRYSIELLFFAYRDFTAEADAILKGYGLGRAHHRVIYFVGRKEGISVGELLTILGITKQSLARVLSRLVEDGFIAQNPGTDDRRRRLLALTDKGRKLEAALTEVQKKRFAHAYSKVGFDAVDGFLGVMQNMLDAETLPLLRPHRARK